MECLNATSFEWITEVSLFSGVGAQCKYHTDWEPSVDGQELTDLVWRLAVRGQMANVPVIVGFNQDEGTQEPCRLMNGVAHTDKHNVLLCWLTYMYTLSSFVNLLYCV